MKRKTVNNNLRWYAAYHNKEKNPHVHMLVWSDRPREAYLDKTGFHNIKKMMAGDIFRQENYSVYKRQTEHRDHIRQGFRGCSHPPLSRIRLSIHLP